MSLPLFYLHKRFCMYRRKSCFSLYLLIKCIIRIMGFVPPPVVYTSPTAGMPVLSSSISSAPESNTSCWDSDIPPILPSLAGRSSVYCSVHPLSLPCAGALSTFLHFPYTAICCSFHVPHVFSFVVGKTVL